MKKITRFLKYWLWNRWRCKPLNPEVWSPKIQEYANAKLLSSKIKKFNLEQGDTIDFPSNL